MESLPNKKSALRDGLKKARLELSVSRRKEASISLMDLLPQLAHYSSVLSFVSLSSEIDTSQLNLSLASQNKLLLPKVFANTLKIYRVTDLNTQLEKGKFGLYEPIPAKCEEVRAPDIVLVPALGFDKDNHRIGYGKGYYDRFLATVKCTTIGIGFREQLLNKLPTVQTDLPLTLISLH